MLEIIQRAASHDSLVRKFLEKAWGATRVVSRGHMHDAFTLPGFVALLDGKAAGLATYNVESDACELVTLDASVENRGVGSALIQAVAAVARERGCSRLWLITTNDNLRAQAFYGRRGFRLVAVHTGALEASRELKPEIPMLGIDGVPISDEIEYELAL